VTPEASVPDPLLLPAGTRLLHVGPPKTGTTALQGAFHAARRAAEAQGVHYAGRTRHSIKAVQAVLGRPGFFTAGEPPSIRHWQGLVREIHGARAERVVLSSEFLADAKPDTIRRVADDLDATRVHVVVTLRPLTHILPSQWQQYVQSSVRIGFDDWLDAMLRGPAGSVTRSFWHRHRHDQLIARWMDVVGAGNVTVVALDPADRGHVLRTFERLTGLRHGTLVPDHELDNRSLTLAEAEAIRAFNVAFREEGLGRALHSRVMNFGAARSMKRVEPPADAQRIEVPQWALDRAGEIEREMVDAILASGVRVVGDPESLTVVPVSPLAGDRLPAPAIPPEVAARMAMGVLVATGAPRRAARTPARLQFAEPQELVRMPTSTVVGVLAGRGRQAAARWWRRRVTRGAADAPGGRTGRSG